MRFFLIVPALIMASLCFAQIDSTEIHNDGIEVDHDSVEIDSAEVNSDNASVDSNKYEFSRPSFFSASAGFTNPISSAGEQPVLHFSNNNLSPAFSFSFSIEAPAHRHIDVIIGLQHNKFNSFSDSLRTEDNWRHVQLFIGPALVWNKENIIFRAFMLPALTIVMPYSASKTEPYASNNVSNTEMYEYNSQNTISILSGIEATYARSADSRVWYKTRVTYQNVGTVSRFQGQQGKLNFRYLTLTLGVSFRIGE